MDHWPLAHMIMGAKKFHNLLSASWKTRKNGGVIKSESKDLRTTGANRVSYTWGPKAQESGDQWYKCQFKFEGLRTRSTDVQWQIDDPAQAENKFALSLPFYSIQALNRLDDVYIH